MTLELSVFLVALAPVLLRVWQGWRCGATREIRYLLMYLFAMLVALRYWYPATDAVSQWLPRDPRLLAGGVFPVLFFVGAWLASFAIKWRAGHVQSVQANPLDNLLGAILGLFSGAIIGCSLLLIVSVELPVLMAGFDRQKFPLPADQLPFGVFRMVERNVAGIPTQSLSRTPLPELSPGESPAPNPSAFVWD